MARALQTTTVNTVNETLAGAGAPTPNHACQKKSAVGLGTTPARRTSKTWESFGSVTAIRTRVCGSVCKLLQAGNAEGQYTWTRMCVRSKQSGSAEPNGASKCLCGALGINAVCRACTVVATSVQPPSLCIITIVPATWIPPFSTCRCVVSCR